MDLNDTPEEAAYRTEVRTWLDANATPKSASDDEGAVELFAERSEDEAAYIKESREWQAKKADSGWACITWPKEYGGRGGGAIQQVIWGQEASKFHAPESIFVIGQGMGGPTIMTHGTDEQKERWLRPLLRGEEIWCQLFSEPAAGSDVGGLTARALRDGDEFIVNGQKVWTSGAHYSKWGMLVTRTDPDAPKHKGITYMMVDMESEGVSVKPLKQMTGGANFNEVFFDNVRIPVWNVIGEINDGWRVAMTTLMNERVALGAGGGGGGTTAIIKLAKNTQLNGKPATEDALIRQELAQLYIWSSALRYTGYRTLSKIARGQIPGPEGSIGKLLSSKLLTRSGDVASRILGPAAVELGPDAPDRGAWAGLVLSSPGMHIAGGTDEILKNLIGDRVLGLPREPRVDKDVPFKEIPTGTLA